MMGWMMSVNTAFAYFTCRLAPLSGQNQRNIILLEKRCLNFRFVV